MNKNDIIRIMEEMAQSGLIFSNEQDFQFEFARKIREDKKLNVKKVMLEVLTLDGVFMLDNNPRVNRINKAEKQYTDIVVQTNSGEYIAIELKYKLPYKICEYQTQGTGRVVTMAQGAYDIGAYDYINDISRLESINNRYFLNNITIKTGYAILLTNDKNYRYNNFSRSDIWKNYSLSEFDIIGIQRAFIPNVKLQFRSGNAATDYYATSNRWFYAIKLNNACSIEWYDYALNGYNDYEDHRNSIHPGFSYLVAEVEQQ